MRIEWICVEGWMPFEEPFSFDLPAGPIALVGMHSGDTRRSNRAGKTALLEAITWCLYGAHRKRTEDAVINRNKTACVVQVSLTGLFVNRSRKRGQSTKLNITIDGVTYTGEQAQLMIEQHIGLQLEDYVATSCFRQGEIDSLIMRTPGERLTLVSDWLQQSKWLVARKLQLQKTNAIDLRLTQSRADVKASQEYVLNLGNTLKLKAELQRMKEHSARLEGHRDFASKQLEKCLAEQDRDHAKCDLEDTRARAVEVRTLLKGRVGAEAALAAAKGAENIALTKSSALETSLDELREVQQGGFSGLCPVMCEECPAAAQVTNVAKTKLSLLDERRRELDKANNRLYAAQAQVGAHRREIAGFDQLSGEYQQLVVRGKQLAAQVQAEPDGEVLVEQELRDTLQSLQIEVQQAHSSIGEMQNTLDMSARAEQRYKQLVDDIEVIEEESQVSSLALRAISSVPARIASQQLTELEQEANSLLAGSGVSLRFSWARELSDKAPNCPLCGFVYSSKRGDECPQCKAPRGKKLAQELELLCEDGSGQEEDARFQSGGTRAIVGSAVRLSASAMLRRLRSSPAAWAIVDEPFGALDSENREQMARMFAGMLSSVGLEQALVVSHDAALLDALPTRIIVDKDGSRATARIE